jgi:cytidylate kinase
MRVNKSILLIGEISSGKTTLAKLIATHSNFGYVGFGAFLKEKFPEYVDRTDLQNLGEELVNRDPRQFVTEVILAQGHGNQNLVFDGVRHHAILSVINAISGSCLTIFIDATYEQRLDRYLSRHRVGDDFNRVNFDQINSHPVERGIRELKEFSDVVVPSSENVGNDFDLILPQIKKFIQGD